MAAFVAAPELRCTLCGAYSDMRASQWREATGDHRMGGPSTSLPGILLCDACYLLATLPADIILN